MGRHFTPPMKRTVRLAAVAALVALVLAVSYHLRSWGGVALLAVLAGGYAWYRIQVARGEAAERFFGDMGEETRLTGFQAGSPSEMPVDRPLTPHESAEPPRH